MDENVHIALIEDDEPIRDSLQMYLQMKGIAVDAYANLEDCLATITGAQTVDCVVTDIRLPGRSGLELHGEFNGTKAWVTNAGVGEVYVCIASTDPSKGPKGISAFAVTRDMLGLRVSRFEDKMGLRASKTAEVVLDGVRVPATHRLGAEGEGMRVALESLSGGRNGIAAQAVEIAEAALREAVLYARERVAFGRPIGEFQGVQWLLADAHVEIEAARMLVLRAADLRDRGLPYATESSMAKCFASEVANRVCAAAVQVHGANGYSRKAKTNNPTTPAFSIHCLKLRPFTD